MITKEFFQSKTFRRILCGVGALVLCAVVFQAGLFVGYRKAAFSYGWGDNYYRTFGDFERGGRRGENSGSIFGMRGGMMGGFFRGGFTASSGAAGKIIKVSLPTIVVQGADGVEKVVLISGTTAVRQFRQALQPSDLQVNESVVVIGSPDAQSQINATLIRVMPVMK